MNGNASVRKMKKSFESNTDTDWDKHLQWYDLLQKEGLEELDRLCEPQPSKEVNCTANSL